MVSAASASSAHAGCRCGTAASSRQRASRSPAGRPVCQLLALQQHPAYAALSRPNSTVSCRRASPEGRPVALQQDVDQRDAGTPAMRLAQKAQGRKGVEMLFARHGASSASAMGQRTRPARQGTARQQQPGRPGLRMRSTEAPASRKSGVRSCCTPVTARRGSTCRRGRAMPE